jgi:hypothetical protein
MSQTSILALICEVPAQIKRFFVRELDLYIYTEKDE